MNSKKGINNREDNSNISEFENHDIFFKEWERSIRKFRMYWRWGS